MTSPLRDLPVGTIPNDEELGGTESVTGDGRNSRQSSLRGPYREGEANTSFPIYCTSGGHSSPAQVYSRSLLSLGNGFALYDVLGNKARHTEHLRLGALLGDVGYMDKSVPPNFSPAGPAPTADNIVTTGSYFQPGTVMASQGVSIRLLPGSPVKIEFASSAREAAVLVLPTGASREELMDTSNLLPYIRDQVAGWYQHFNGGSETSTSVPVANGTLCIVVGVDRADSCAMATLSESASATKKHAKFVYTEEPDAAMTWNSDSQRRPHYRKHKFSDGKLVPIFLRVISVALNPTQWSEHVASIQPDWIPYYSVLPIFSVGIRAWFRGVFDSGKIPRSSDGEPIFFYPSIILLHILLLTNSAAYAGVVPDSIWLSQLSQRHFAHSEVVELMRRVIQNYDLVTTDGVAIYVPKSEQTGLASYVTRIVPWMSSLAKDKPNSALYNMAKVLGILKP